MESNKITSKEAVAMDKHVNEVKISLLENKVLMSVKSTGQHVNFFDGSDGIGSNAQYEITEIKGGSLPALEYEQAPLPRDVPRPVSGKRERIHKVGDVIGEDAVEELEYLGVEIIRTK